MKILFLLLLPIWACSQDLDISSQKDYPKYQQIFKPLLANLDSLVLEIGQVSEDQKADVLNKYTEAVTKLNEEVEKFIYAHTSSLVSLQALKDTLKFHEDIEDAERMFNLLSEEVKNSPKGKELADYFFSQLGTNIGRDATDFSQPDVNGNLISLSSFKGKYVLLDFWASWCGPCRRENPNFINAYHKFKNKNFTVFAVSLDEHRQQWLAAIEKDGLPWTNVSDLKYWSNEAAKIYNVKAVPTNFLIDPNGKILAKNLRGAELEAKLCEILNCDK